MSLEVSMVDRVATDDVPVHDAVNGVTARRPRSGRLTELTNCRRGHGIAQRRRTGYGGTSASADGAAPADDIRAVGPVNVGDDLHCAWAVVDIITNC